MKKIGELALWLLIIGGLLMGYDAWTGRDLISALFRNTSLDTMIRAAIGVSALIVLGGKVKK